MAFNNITSANASIWVVILEKYPAGFALDHFATDTALSMDSVVQAEVRMGVDGKMSAGFTPTTKVVTINLEPGSQAATFFDLTFQAQQTFKTLYNINMVCTIPDINRVYVWDNGVMREGTPLPSLSTVLEPTTWVFEFERMTLAPTGI